MAVAVDYSSNHFDSLPSLDDALQNFRTLDIDAVMSSVKGLFVESGMERTFGLVMLHRHFDIGPEQKMVNYNGTSTPWDAIYGEGMDEPQPITWSFSSGVLLPIEFGYSKGHKVKMGEKELAFVTGFGRLLDGMNLTSTFGLCEYPGDEFGGTCEITIGKTNINLMPKDVRQLTTQCLSLTCSDVVS
jgi:hypothetical protein